MEMPEQLTKLQARACVGLCISVTFIKSLLGEGEIYY
jgi:hypothetical protein